MQALNEQQYTADTRIPEAESEMFTLSVEWILIAILVSVAVILRLANIDTVPMSDLESTQALAALHTVMPDVPGTFEPATSPIIFWLQTIGFTLFGATEFAARLPGIIGGVVLILMPFLYRAQIGSERAFAMSLLLLLSPVAFIAARTADPAIWTAVFVLGGIQATWAYWQTNRTSKIVQAFMWFGAMAFLTESGGLMLGLVLGIAACVGLWWVLLDAADILDEPGDEAWQRIRAWLQTFPVGRSVALTIFMIVLVATGAMFYPAGLSSVSGLVGEFFSGFINAPHPNVPFGIGLLSLLVYELALVLFGVVGVVLALSRLHQAFFGRFLVVWTVLGMVVLALYLGAGAGDAMWVVIPLAFLVSDVIAELVRRILRLLGFDIVMPAHKYGWSKWLVGLAIFGVMLLLAINWQIIGNNLFVEAQGLFSLLADERFAQYRYSVLWVVIIILLLVMGYFLSGSIFGHANTWQGYGLGLVGFMLLANIIGGWNAAVENADNPAEIWYPTAVSADAYLLRDTLYEIAQRDNSGFPTLPVTIVQDDGAIIEDDGLVAWLVRDFKNAHFVTALSEAQRDSLVVMVDDAPELGGSYVGQSFALRAQWSLGALRGNEIISWWTQRRIRQDTITQELAILWLRQDIYDGANTTD